MVIPQAGGWYLTKAGKEKAMRIVRLHRLWELYLTRFADMSPLHVHENAELIEHILTPELEKELEKELGYPERDPHNSIIPKL